MGIWWRRLDLWRRGLWWIQHRKGVNFSVYTQLWRFPDMQLCTPDTVANRRGEWAWGVDVEEPECRKRRTVTSRHDKKSPGVSLCTSQGCAAAAAGVNANAAPWDAHTFQWGGEKKEGGEECWGRKRGDICIDCLVCLDTTFSPAWTVLSRWHHLSNFQHRGIANTYTAELYTWC